MAFEGLSQKLSGALSKLTGRGKLSEQAVKEAMREVRMALLKDIAPADQNDQIRLKEAGEVIGRIIRQQEGE